MALAAVSWLWPSRTGTNDVSTRDIKDRAGLFTPTRSIELGYLPLSTMFHEIRILNLDSSVIGRLECTLQTVKLTNPGNYTALSYRYASLSITVEQFT
jgi:hypothetical protein